jgi:hypothetical protein
MVRYLHSERTTTRAITTTITHPNKIGNKDSGISISIHLDSSIVVSVNNFFVPTGSFSRVFFVPLVEKKKNPDGLPLAGNDNEIREKGITPRTDSTYRHQNIQCRPID